MHVCALLLPDRRDRLDEGGLEAGALKGIRAPPIQGRNPKVRLLHGSYEGTSTNTRTQTYI